MSADTISQGVTSSLSACFQNKIPQGLASHLQALQVLVSSLLQEAKHRLEDCTRARKDCRDKVFEGRERDFKIRSLMVSSLLCSLLFPEDVVSSCLATICESRSSPFDVFHVKTSSFRGKKSKGRKVRGKDQVIQMCGNSFQSGGQKAERY